MKALVLAAGRSKRMEPIGDKNFLNFLGKPLIQQQLEFLSRNGFKDIVVVGSLTNIEKIKEVGSKIDGNVSVCEQKDLDLGMAGAVLAARHLIDGPVLIFSSNDVVEDKALQMIQENEGSCMIGKKVDHYFPGGYLEVNDSGYIQNIVEKPGEGHEPSDMVNLVIHKHQDIAELVEYLEKAKSGSDDLYEVAVSNMMRDGVKIKALPYDGFWQPIKYPWNVHRVFEHLFAQAKKGISSSAEIAESAVIKGDVIIEDGAKVMDGAVISGPVYIGKESIVANNALLRGSHIGEGCMVGFSTEVARSYWGNKVWTHMNYVGDSVIGNDVSFGAGAVTGNLRLDDGNVEVDGLDTRMQKVGAIIGDKVRVGINTSIMPGIKIGSNTFIGAGIVIANNVPEGSFVRASFELKISENKFKK